MGNTAFNHKPTNSFNFIRQNVISIITFPLTDKKQHSEVAIHVCVCMYACTHNIHTHTHISIITTRILCTKTQEVLTTTEVYRPTKKCMSQLIERKLEFAVPTFTFFRKTLKIERHHFYQNGANHIKQPRKYSKEHN